MTKCLRKTMIFHRKFPIRLEYIVKNRIPTGFKPCCFVDAKPWFWIAMARFPFKNCIILSKVCSEFYQIHAIFAHELTSKYKMIHQWLSTVNHNSFQSFRAGDPLRGTMPISDNTITFCVCIKLTPVKFKIWTRQRNKFKIKMRCILNSNRLVNTKF